MVTSYRYTMVRAGRQMVMWRVQKCPASPVAIVRASWKVMMRGVKEGSGRAEHSRRMQGKGGRCSRREAIT